MNEIISNTLLLLLIIDPLGNLPIFMSILKNIKPKKRILIIIREMLIALLFMLFFIFFGEHILSLLSLRTESISISGGIILFLIAIKMIFPNQQKEKHSTENIKEPFLIPLAIPLISGPSILATLMLMSHKYPEKNNNLIIGLILSWIISMIILMLSNILLKIIGKNGIEVLEKIMGLLLIMISIQMFLDGIRAYLHT